MSDKYARARAIGAEAEEIGRQMDEINASVERTEQREKLAIEFAQSQATDDLEIPGDMDVAAVESVDGGYWVAARVWVGADEVEDELHARQMIAGAFRPGG